MKLGSPLGSRINKLESSGGGEYSQWPLSIGVRVTYLVPKLLLGGLASYHIRMGFKGCRLLGVLFIALHEGDK